MKIIKIKSSDILWDQKNTFYSSPQSTDSLKESIRCYGLLSHPIVYPEAENKYIIVSGWQRLLTLSALKADAFDFEAIVLDSVDNWEKHCLDLSLSDNLSHRSLTHMEKANFIFKLKHTLKMADKEILKEYFPKLSLNRGMKVLEEMLMLGDLSDEQKKKINEKAFPAEYFSCLSDYSQELRDIVIALSLELNIGLNVIKEISLGLFELSLRENKSVLSVSENILNGAGDLPRREKTEYIRSQIQQQRNPLFTVKKDQLDTLIKNTGFFPKIKIRVPASFEGSKISFSFDADNQKQLLAHLEKINEAVLENKIQAIWDFMKL